MSIRTIKRDHIPYKGRPVIIDTAELAPGQFETVAMYSGGHNLSTITTKDQAAALAAHANLLARYTGQPVPGQYTMEDWSRDRDFSALPGQEISEEVFDEWLDCLPPLSIPRSAGCCGFLCSEPVRHDSAGALYHAFGSSNGRFYYLGLMHAEGEEQ